MIGFGVFSWFAGALQLVVPSYAFRLVRRFGTSRVGWFVVTVFAALALMHVLTPPRSVGAGAAFGGSLDFIYAIGSVLLLIGMGHMETLISERDRVRVIENTLQRKWQAQVKEQTADLVAAKEELQRELQRQEAIRKTLEESEAHYRFLFEENPMPMWILDLRSCRFLTVNQSALRLYGFSLEEFMALTGRDLLLPSAVAQFLQDVAKPCSGVESRGEWQHCRKDGTLIEVEISAVDLGYAGVPARLILATDITRRRRHEQKMRRIHRMEVISQVAGGVAHYFNNLIGLIETNASTLQAKPLDLQSSESLEQIHESMTRAAGLTRQLLAAGGRQLIRQEAVDLNGLIRNMNPILRRLMNDRIVLECTFAAHLPPVLADRHQVEQMIVNLALNAREAMPGGGSLALHTARIHVSEEQADNDPQIKSGDFVRLIVRDSGCGMAPQIQSRLFEPFFTTRDATKRFGLGLASVFGIVHQHCGFIDFNSDAGVGTEFRVCLPVAPDAFSVPNTAAAAGQGLAKATILLVEPDDRGRALARFVLDRHGYHVIEADSSATALVLWAGQAQAVDLLLVDAGLPGELTGQDLVTRLREARPGLKVVFTTRAPEMGSNPAPESLEGFALVSKPYNPDALIQTVQASLDA